MTKLVGTKKGILLALAVLVSALALGCVVALPLETGPVARRNLEEGDQEGQLAPDFELEDLDGNEIRLSDYRGQVVLINFWATWCGYCRAEFPEMQRAYERNQDRGFIVLAINLQDRRQSVQAYVQEMGLTFPVLLDPLGRATGKYETRRLPTSYFVDQEGVILLKKVGPVDEAMILEVLAQAGVE
jgi:peroxiredoxin